MATFSPSPAPRRNVRRPGGNSPPVAGRRTRVGSSRPTSRLATPMIVQDRLSVVRDVGSSPLAMEVDNMGEWDSRSEMTFAKSEELLVTFAAHLPVELKQVLRYTGILGHESYSGVIDTATGYALVASSQTCFVWQYAQAVKGIPTCYIFSCPMDFDQPSPPYHALVPYGPSREPGLMLISPSGEVRFWDSVGIGLAGGEHFTTSTLGLASGETVTNLIRSDLHTYIVSSSTGRLFRLTLTSSGGKRHLNSHPFARPSNSLSFSRLFPSIWSSSSSSATPETGNISAVALGAKTAQGRDIWALVDTRLQKWNMTIEGWEEIVMDEELADMIRGAIRDTFPSASSDNSILDLELLDLALESSGNMVILASYAGIDGPNAMDTGDNIRRPYVLTRLSSIDGAFSVESVSSIPYQSTLSSGSPTHPRLHLILGGSIVSVQFGDTITLCARDSHYQDRLGLKSSQDRTLGVGVIEGDSVLLVLSASAMMKVCVNTVKVADFDANVGRANLIKSTMTQAILYGSNPQNPLNFSFPPEVDEESLMQGAEQLSQAVLESDTELVQRNHDLTAQLSERKGRLSWLIRFINDNAVLTKMSQRSRQRLATDAEKLHACYQLWVQHNDILSTGFTGSVLSEAVHMYMNEIGEGHHEDIMRAFFRQKAGSIGELLPVILTKAEGSSTKSRSSLAALSDANSAVLTVLTSAFSYRDNNLRVYGVELPMIMPWTSQPQVIETVLSLFEDTTRCIEAPASIQPGESKSRPTSQLADLASTLLTCIQERLDWLRSPIAANEVDAESSRVELEERFSLICTDVFEVLRRNGHAETAFNLAEYYRDFRSLASLCNKEIVFPVEKNPYAVRIQTYLKKFKDEFARELYRWYIEQGELRAMFAQEDVYSGYMDVFFAEHPHPSVSWIHDLGKARYGPTSQTLYDASQSSPSLQIKHLMLSIGKLAHLAQLHETETSADTSILDSFHDDLDFVSVQEKLLENFKFHLRSLRGKQTVDTQVEAISHAEASTISEKRALLHIFKQLVRRLLRGEALSVEDVVDLLTLKDNMGSKENYRVALQLLVGAKDLPEARRISACRSVWRRVYIHDDWDVIRQTAGVTDMELGERFRGTALYLLLSSVLLSKYQRPGWDLTPAQSLPIPTANEITARWPGMAPDSTEEILSNHQDESDRVVELDLNDVYHRVRELVMQDLLWAEEQQG